MLVLVICSILWASATRLQYLGQRQQAWLLSQRLIGTIEQLKIQAYHEAKRLTLTWDENHIYTNKHVIAIPRQLTLTYTGFPHFASLTVLPDGTLLDNGHFKISGPNRTYYEIGLASGGRTQLKVI